MFPLPPDLHRVVFALQEQIRALPPRAQFALLTQIARDIERDHFPLTAEEQAAAAPDAEELAEIEATNGYNEPPYPIEEVLAEMARLQSRPQDPSCDVAKSTT